MSTKPNKKSSGIKRNALSEEINDSLHETVDQIKKKVTPEPTLLKDEIQELRQKLLDWMLVIIGKLKLSDQCYFIAVGIFDDYIQKSLDLPKGDFHIIAVVSLVLASKFEEANYITLDNAYKNLCYKKYSFERLRTAELEILMTLKCKLPRDYFEEFCISIVDLTRKRTSDTNATKAHLKAANFVYKLLLQNYNFQHNYNQILQYFSIVYFCLNNEFKHERFRGGFQSFKFFEIADKYNVKMKDILCINEQIINEFSYFKENLSDFEFLNSNEYSLLFV